MPFNKKQTQARMRKQVRKRKKTSESFNRESDRVLTNAIRNADKQNPEAIDLENLLLDSGFEDLIDSFEEAFGEEIEVIAENFEALTGRTVLSVNDFELIESIASNEFERIALIQQEFGVDIKAELIRSKMVGRPPNVSNLEDLQERVGNKIATEYNTAIASFCRTVTITKAVDEFGNNPEFQYIGPDDNKTREFCQDVLDGAILGDSRQPPAFKLNEILQMDNGQGLDVFSSGGGYNCRHEWVPTGN